ncbi:hypothetical protein N7494_005781 [Penicillium frequentans]|uniref:EDC4-like protein pdc1 beta-propeller domain-containing protein n=1 Tax=Penicillium frequentans TaxID=3151616 RepID=A0AAD6GG00_9EURO|nr:hypothetical protein N7494_005781 [Penicillium glabrum]
MSTPNDLQALLASIRPRPSPNHASGQESGQQQQQQQRPVQPGYAQPQYHHPGMFPHHPQYPPFDARELPPAMHHPDMHRYQDHGVHGYHHPSVASAVQSPSPMNPVNTPLIMHPILLCCQFAESPKIQPGLWCCDPIAGCRYGLGKIAVSPVQEVASSLQGRNTSSSNLMASLFGGAQAPAQPAAPEVATPTPVQEDGAPSDQTQNMLLRLLNRSQFVDEATEVPLSVASNQSNPEASVETKPSETNDILTEPVAPFVEAAKPETVVSPSSKESMFTYVNPFDQLAAISPGTRSPQPKSDYEPSVVEDMQKLEVNPSADEDASPAIEFVATQKPKRSKSPVLEPGQKQAVNDVVSRLVSEIGRSLSSGEIQAEKAEVDAEVEAEAEAEALAAEPTEAVISSIADRLRETVIEPKEVAEMPQSTEPEKGSDVEAATTADHQTRNENAEALADSWESAEDSAEKEEVRVVSVRNFPLQPFISVIVKPQPGKIVSFRDDAVMDIARLKKDFDQLDRSLTAATSDYIVYALAKTGGIRIIRQDDGSDRQVFRSTRDRVFNVSLCSSLSAVGQSEVQAILGIGVSGAVYWSLISREGKDLFEMDALESESLIFPPFPASDENTSGGQLKTRAKQSSRHADLIAIGRGKCIYVVSPQAAMNASYGVSGAQRTVITEKFFKERALKISTGKAGKDFAFSGDDTVIASLDKTGRLRFWDIRDLLDRDSFAEGPVPNEVRVPLNTFVTGSPAEKSWPTSVLFVDKLRPYTRSSALRYVLVGLKQNHTLQLWDIGLGKAVGEVNFPHENESDAICSVVFHASSGIIVVGHPTRNSIYFVHLSAPRYNLPGMSQAAFIKAAGDKESSLPRPDSTACLSGIREISLGSKGQLRSLELLPLSKTGTEKRASEETDLFELYVMHSRGVTCLNIKRDDLGWTSDNKVISPIDALEEGSIEVRELQSFPPSLTEDPSVNGDTPSPTTRTPKDTAKKNDIADSTGLVSSRNLSSSRNPSPPVDEQSEPAALPHSIEKLDKKKKKKAPADASKLKEPTSTVGVEPLPLPSSKELETLTASTATMSNPHAHEMASSNHLDGAYPTVGQVTEEQMAQQLKEQFENSRGEFMKDMDNIFGSGMERLFARFDDERHHWDTASNVKQENLLRLVSDKLSSDLEKNFRRMFQEAITDDVTPAVDQSIHRAISRVLETNMLHHLPKVLREQLHQIMPRIIESTVENPALVDAVASRMVKMLEGHVQKGVTLAVSHSFMPFMEEFAKRSKQASDEAEARIKILEEAREKDRVTANITLAKLEQMENAMRAMVAHMGQLTANNHPTTNTGPSNIAPAANIPVQAPAQAPVQAPVQSTSPVRDPRLLNRPERSSSALASPSIPALSEELADIDQMLSGPQPQYHEAIVKWLQSARQAEIFDNYFCQTNPSFLAQLPAIVVLSAGVAVTASLQQNISARLHWLEVSLRNVDLQDPEVSAVAAQILSLLSNRLGELYNAVHSRNPSSSLLQQIIPLSRALQDMYRRVPAN